MFVYCFTNTVFREFHAIQKVVYLFSCGVLESFNPFIMSTFTVVLMTIDPRRLSTSIDQPSDIVFSNDVTALITILIDRSNEPAVEWKKVDLPLESEENEFSISSSGKDMLSSASALNELFLNFP